MTVIASSPMRKPTAKTSRAASGVAFVAVIVLAFAGTTLVTLGGCAHTPSGPSPDGSATPTTPTAKPSATPTTPPPPPPPTLGGRREPGWPPRSGRGRASA
jgi:hypothetical protein